MNLAIFLLLGFFQLINSQCPKSGLNVTGVCWYSTADNQDCTSYCTSQKLVYKTANFTARQCQSVLEAWNPLRLKANATRGNSGKGCYWSKDRQILSFDGPNWNPSEKPGNRSIRFCPCETGSWEVVWTFDNVFCMVVIIVLFILLAFEVWTPEYLLFSAALLLYVAGVISLTQLIQGFSNTGILTVAVLYICVRPLNDLRLLRVFIHRFVLCSPTKPRLTLFVTFGAIGFLSFFLNNTPLVAMMIPFVKDWCRANNTAPSMYLLPVSYAAILGGVCTVIGTSTNLVIQGFLARDGLPLIGFFEIGVAGGFLIFLVGWIYVVGLGPILLPKAGGMFRLARERGAEFMLQLEVTKDCPMVGKQLVKLRGRLPRSEQQNVQFVEILRQVPDEEPRVIFPLEPTEIIHANDRILLSGHVKGIVSAITATPGLKLLGKDGDTTDFSAFGLDIASGMDELQGVLPTDPLVDGDVQGWH